MAIVKGPQNVGDELTATITDCKEVKGKFGQQVAFDFDNGDTLFLPAATAARQLIRCGFVTQGENPLADYEAVAGNDLTFGREDNPNGKPYWSIQLADGLAKTVKKPAKRMTQAEALAGPPAHHRDVPPPDAPEMDFEPSAGKQDGKATLRQQNWEAIERAYRWALFVSLNAQLSLNGEMEGDAPQPTAESIQAGAATLLIQAEKMGAIR